MYRIIIDRNQISHRWEDRFPEASREKRLEKLTIDTVYKFKDHKIKEDINKKIIEISNVEDEFFFTEDEQRLIELMREKDKLIVSNLMLKEEIAKNYFIYINQN